MNSFKEILKNLNNQLDILEIEEDDILRKAEKGIKLTN